MTTPKYQMSIDLSDLHDHAIALAENAISSTRVEGARPVDNFVRALLSLAGAVVEVSSTGGNTREAVDIAKGALDRWIELLQQGAETMCAPDAPTFPTEHDALHAEVERMRPVYEAASACPFTSGDGWLMCQLKKGHGGSCQMKDVSITKASRT